VSEANGATEEDEVDDGAWFAVRCVFDYGHNRPVGPRDLGPGEHAYEERLTLWYAATADEAIELAEKEADEYAASAGCAYTGLAQSYWLEEEPGHGAVAFSLVRKSNLAPDAYIDAFFDTGQEYEEAPEGQG